MGLLLNPLMIAGMVCVTWTLTAAECPPKGGAVYTRWGKTYCSGGSELLYSGRAGGTRVGVTGGSANFLCMPNDPQYSRYSKEQEGYSSLTGVLYKAGRFQPFRSVFDTNMPCAVCYSPSRIAVLMIPAKLTCPTGWTTEYTGYIMGGPYSNDGRYFYECIDGAPQSVPGSGHNPNNADLYHVEATCDSLSCPPYHPRKELTCVVCTR